MRVDAISTDVGFSAMALALLLGAAFAQPGPAQGQEGSPIQLPEACQTGEASGMPAMESMQPATEGMGEHQQAFMQVMMQTQQPMMQGIMAEDADVAFACGMIAHHQTAIDMAEVELQHGDAEPMKQVAQSVIDAQQQEITELTQWLEEQSR